MKKRKAKSTSPAAPAEPENPPARSTPPIPPPIDVVDGIPDRRPDRPIWIYLLLAAIFLAWAVFLIFVQIHG